MAPLFDDWPAMTALKRPKAWAALAKFYRVLRKYVNFFQPSVKLLKKTRTGAKVAKQYDKALTPYQRTLP
jgi:hypothetical protein